MTEIFFRFKLVVAYDVHNLFYHEIKALIDNEADIAENWVYILFKLVDILTIWKVPLFSIPFAKCVDVIVILYLLSDNCGRTAW